MKVLVVSLSERARAWMRMALGPRWEASEAANGLEALRMARADTPDLVVADEGTEPFGAFGLARELKMLPSPPAMIVLLERGVDTWLAKWSGADRWLLQPVDAIELARAANELAGARSAAG